MTLLVLLAPTSGGSVTLLYAYNFDEASGNIVDQSGNGRDTTFGGALSRSASGHTSKGLTQTSAAAESAGPSLTGLQTAQFTMMFWFFRTSNSQVGWVGQLKDAGSGDRGFLFISGNVRGRARNSGGTAGEVIAAEPSINNWHHGAVTYDGSKVHLYLDGVESGTGSTLAAPLKTTSTSSHLLDTLGSETIIDDLRYYDTALDAATITTLMGTPVTGGGGAIDLVPAGATQAQTAGSVALTQVHSLAVNASTQAQTSDAPSLTQVHILAVAGATQAQVADGPTLAVVATLVAQDASQAQASDNVTLTQVHSLTVGNAAQGQAAESPALTQVHSLAAGGALQAQSASTPTLTQVHSLAVADAAQAQISENVDLTAGGGLVVAGATQAQSSQSVTLTQLHILTVAGAVQLQQAEQITLLQVHILQAASAMQGQTAGNLELVAVGAYTPPDEVTATPRAYTSTAAARDLEPTATARAHSLTATARAYSSTATARSPE